MQFIKASYADLKEIQAIFTHAKEFMRQTNNPNQWPGDYPSDELLKQDIDRDSLYKVVENNKIEAVFVFHIGKDPTYATIDGAWLNDEPYGVIHRIASTGKIKGIADKCINFCFNIHPNLRIDTHEDNLIMQNAILRNGFKYCGIIYLPTRGKRLAYQKVS